MRVNDLIFKELLKRGYKLEGKIRVWDVADSKLWYLTPKQAQGFLDLSKTDGYKNVIINNEISLIVKHMEDFVYALRNRSCNIIDLGCGDGQKASLFIEKLAARINIRYCPVDISSYMVSRAAKTIRKKKVGEVLEFKWNISDFENLDNITPLFRDSNFDTHFMMLLGNTLGNFSREDILHGIKKSMNKNDILLIGNGLINGHKDWTEEYKDNLINKWLIQIPQQLGLSKNDIVYDVRFVNSRVEELYILKNDKTVKHLGRSLNFRKGDMIIAAISYKYTESEFKKIIKKFFSDVKIYLNDNKSYALALCRR